MSINAEVIRTLVVFSAHIQKEQIVKEQVEKCFLKRAIKTFPGEIHKTITLCCLVQSVEIGLDPVIALII